MIGIPPSCLSWTRRYSSHDPMTYASLPSADRSAFSPIHQPLSCCSRTKQDAGRARHRLQETSVASVGQAVLFCFGGACSLTCGERLSLEPDCEKSKHSDEILREATDSSRPIRHDGCCSTRALDMWRCSALLKNAHPMVYPSRILFAKSVQRHHRRKPIVRVLTLPTVRSGGRPNGLFPCAGGNADYALLARKRSFRFPAPHQSQRSRA